MHKVMRQCKLLSIMVLLLLEPLYSLAQANDELGEYEFGMRTRYHEVTDAWLGDAQALTTRVKLTAKFSLDELLPSEDGSWQVLIEPNYVYAFNDEDYNSVTVTRAASPIPDPEGFNLSKVFFSYVSDDDWQLQLGRQALSFDNERMVAAIEFWQTPQNFDALSFTYNDQMNWQLQYAYSSKVHRVFGQDATLQLPKDDIRYGLIDQRPLNELGEHKLNAHFFNLNYKTDDNLSLAAYNYFIDNKSQPKFSTNTVGFRINDEFKPAKLKYRYTAEFAWQESIADNPDNFQVWYNLLEASVQYKSHIVQLGQEIVSEEQGTSFKSSLGNNHKFQGWADVFTSYNSGTGLRDQTFTYRGRHKKLRWRMVYHHFKSYSDSINIGNELDIELAYRLTRKWQFKVVYADYQADEGLSYFPKANFDLTTWFVSVAYNI